ASSTARSAWVSPKTSSHGSTRTRARPVRVTWPRAWFRGPSARRRSAEHLRFAVRPVFGSWERVACAACIAGCPLRPPCPRDGGGLLLARPPDDSLDDVEPLIEEALAAAARGGVTGQAVTPFVLTYLHEHSGGRTLAANRDLVVANATLAAEVAVSQ